MRPALPENEERHLLAEYGTATRAYSRAVSELARQRGIVRDQGYLELLMVVEKARKECERVRLALQRLQIK